MSFYGGLFQKNKTGKLRKLGIAHERTNYKQFLIKSRKRELADSHWNWMDLLNNESWI